MNNPSHQAMIWLAGNIKCTYITNKTKSGFAPIEAIYLINRQVLAYWHE